MNRDLVEILGCPDCGGCFSLSAPSGAAAWIERGTLHCEGCSRSYPIEDGIPRVLPANGGSDPAEVSRHFAREFTELAENDADLASPELEEYYFFSRTGIDPGLYENLPGDPYRTELPVGTGAYRPDTSYLAGKWVLDAGCGPGRFIPVAAGSGAARVVGLELGDHVERAARRLAGRDNVDLVQGSVLQPPFRSEAFDYVYTIGVVHHTPDPRSAVHQLASLVRRDGGMSVWVYPPSYWGGFPRAVVGRALHAVLSRLPGAVALAICRRVLYPIGRLQMFVARRPWLKLAFAPLFLISVPRHPKKEVMIVTIYDYYCPPIISTHDYEQVEAWLRESGFTGLTRVPVPTAWFAQYETSPQAKTGGIADRS